MYFEVVIAQLCNSSEDLRVLFYYKNENTYKFNLKNGNTKQNSYGFKIMYLQF